MKLTSTQIEQTLDQFEAEPIPENHPMVPQLNEMFGEHTYFVNSDGLIYPGTDRERFNRGAVGQGRNPRGVE